MLYLQFDCPKVIFKRMEKSFPGHMCTADRETPDISHLGTFNTFLFVKMLKTIQSSTT